MSQPDMAIPLSNASLSEIASRGRVSVPRYDRAALRAGILHFGVGNFHRAHLAVYLDALFNADPDAAREWAIVGAGTLQSDEKMRDALQRQDWLTTVVEQDNAGDVAKVTGSMVDFLPVGDSAAIIAQLADPAIRIVSLTITEGGYFLDSDGKFDAAHPAIVADAKASAEQYRTVFGLIVAGLQRRRTSGVPAFTVMSCDNIPHNGAVTRQAVVGMARVLGLPDVAAWIGGEVAFPSSMVDRITPATGERERAACASQFGVADVWPVFCEQFSQWVLEDNFPTGRPALEKVGVQFVPDVVPYELLKLRVLNGGHQAIAYAGALLGCQYAHEAIAHALVGQFLRVLHAREIEPAVPPLPDDTDVKKYGAMVRQRFANPKIADTMRRLAQDASNRQPKFVVPTIAHRLHAGQSVSGLALLSALWCRYCEGIDERGQPIEPNDADWDALQARARQARAQNDPHAWLDSNARVYGAVARNAVFRAAFAKALRYLWRNGTAKALQAYLDNNEEIV